jgi:hypothetical protein
MHDRGNRHAGTNRFHVHGADVGDDHEHEAVHRQ